jgi:NAD(P)-dependent dehydrogenase (short-subunit alcohol dehydrogenase family)
MPDNDDIVRFDGRAVLVTGSGGGLGREYALLLASRGARVVVSDNGSAPADGDGRDAGPANTVVAEIRAAGGEAIAVTDDLSCEAGARGAVETALSAFGRIDAIVHNAGFAAPPEDPDEVSAEAFARMLHVNTFAAFWMINSAWRHMREQGGGRIVLTSSSAIFGSSSVAYGTAKASLVGMGRSLAAKGAAHNILTNVILPAAATRLTARWPASPFTNWFNESAGVEKIAPVVAHLCHEACRLNGEMIAVTGGNIGRVRMLETFGQLGASTSIEDVAGRMPSVMSEESHFFPTDPPTRLMLIAEHMGYVNADADDDPFGYQRRD